MHAIILAGGQGRRLRPYTLVIPKPLIPVGEHPIIEILVRQLVAHGVDRITVSIGHLGEMIRAYLGDGGRFGVAIDYVTEAKPLGTAGPIALVRDPGENFLVLNGDLLTDLDFSAMMNAHVARGGVATVGTFEKKERIELGVLEIRDGLVRDYIEKPTNSYHVSIGVYALNREVISRIPEGERFDLPDLVRRLIAERVDVASHLHTGSWLDIGRFDDHAAAEEILRTEPGRFLPKR